MMLVPESMLGVWYTFCLFRGDAAERLKGLPQEVHDRDGRRRSLGYAEATLCFVFFLCVRLRFRYPKY